jgi:hypothetical protein
LSTGITLRFSGRPGESDPLEGLVIFSIILTYARFGVLLNE